MLPDQAFLDRRSLYATFGAWMTRDFEVRSEPRAQHT